MAAHRSLAQGICQAVRRGRYRSFSLRATSDSSYASAKAEEKSIHLLFMPTSYHAGIEGEFVELKLMVGDKDIWLAAEGLLVAHGLDAVRKCEELIASMIERGDKGGEENWRKILAAVRELPAQD